MGRAHLVAGVIVVLVFLGTGAYMRVGFPGLYGGVEAARFLYRANHIYILYILANALIHLSLGAYLVLDAGGWRRKLQLIGSAMLFVGTALLIPAFFVEPPQVNPERPLTGFGIYAVTAAVVLHLIASLRRAIASAP